MIPVESVLRKLEPCLFENVIRWRRILEFADDETRHQLHQHIYSVANHVLGDLNSKLLLSLPSEFQARGTLNLGTILYEKPKWPAGISPNELLQGYAIFGRSGSGKTTIAFNLIAQLSERKIPFCFLDWKRTARHLLPLLKQHVNVHSPGRGLIPFQFNPFVAPLNVETDVYIKHVVDVMADAYTLGEGAKRVVQRALIEIREENLPPTIENILKVIEKNDAKSRALGWKTSALRALESIQMSRLGTSTPVSQVEAAHEFFQSSNIIELDSLDDSSKAFLVPIFCFWLYSTMMSSKQREVLKLVVFIEEAHHVLFHNEHRAKETLMNQLLRQGRELGIAFVVIDQNPSQISRSALNNTFTTICLNLRDPSDINKAAGLCMLEEEDKKWLSMLPVGQGIVKLQDRWQRPFLVQFPKMNVNKGFMTDERVNAYVSQNMDLHELRADYSQNKPSQLGTSDRFISEDEFRFLHDVLNHPESSVRDRYLRLAIGVNKGHKIKERLVDRGWLQESILPIGKTRKTVVSLPADALEEFGNDIRKIPTNHVIHEYWKRYYAAMLIEEGYQVEIEAPRIGGRVDILATKEKGRVGVEIETGHSDIIGNVKSCIRTGISEIWIVATSDKALKTIERKLAIANLVIPERIRIILRDAASRRAT